MSMEVASDSALHVLREYTTVDCDTLDPQIAQQYGTFVDCTSNQAIAYFELQEPQSQDVLPQAAGLALQWREKFPGVKLDTLAIDIAVGVLQDPCLVDRMALTQIRWCDCPYACHHTWVRKVMYMYTYRSIHSIQTPPSG